MEALKTLLGMDLSDEVKALLTTVSTETEQLQEANTNLLKSIDSKDNANSDAFKDREKLRTEIAALKEEIAIGGNKDNGEQIEAITKAHEEKYNDLQTRYDGLNDKVSQADRLSAFSSLNIAAKFPKDYTEAQIEFANKTIQREVFEGSTFDKENGTWGYGEAGRFELNALEGKPYTIESKAKELLARGSFDMFLAGNQGSGGGTPPNSGQGDKNVPMTLTERLNAKT